MFFLHLTYRHISCILVFLSSPMLSVLHHAHRLLPAQTGVTMYGEHIKWMETAGFRNCMFKCYMARFNVRKLYSFNFLMLFTGPINSYNNSTTITMIKKLLYKKTT